MSLKIALYIGQYRFPLTPSDIGVEFLEAMRAGRHPIGVVLAHPGDIVLRLAHEYGLPTLPLPEELEYPVDRMRRIFEAPELPPHLRAWLDALRGFATDVGIVYCGGWIPPQLAQTPRLGFINLHPGPLPEFTGYDPEKFLILNHHEQGWGTIHHLADKFDTGNVLRTSEPVPLTPSTTTPELAKLISRQCFKALPGVLDEFTRGIPAGTPQNESRRDYVTRRRGHRESVIQWRRDSHAKLDARLRAFNSLDDGMCLKARRQGRLHVVYDLELHAGDYPGKPGEEIGIYRGPGVYENAPLIRTREGVAAVLFGAAVATPFTAVELAPERLIRAAERPRRTGAEFFEIRSES